MKAEIFRVSYEKKVRTAKKKQKKNESESTILTKSQNRKKKEISCEKKTNRCISPYLGSLC